jgi:enoyl-CoA hydratase/carnithine racemase
MNDTTTTKQILLPRQSPAYWRATFDHPPLNIFGPETIPPLNEIVTALENDKHVKVVVFDSAVEGFFLTHYDFLAKVEDTTSLPPGPTGLQPLPDILVRLSRAPVVSIASIRGRATVCRLTTKSHRNGMCALPRSCGRPHKRGSRS